MKNIKHFIFGESGATAVEYAILLALIIALMMVTVHQAGGASGLVFGTNADSISGALNN